MARAARNVPPAELRRTLRRTFGLTKLRGAQEQVIARVVSGLSTLAVMPTGAGKSLCYQLPAVLREGLTVVVSPLLALMKDQCDSLNERGIAAVQLNSGLSAAEAAASTSAVADGSARIVFITPEGLADAEVREQLKARGVALLAVDEAHCISQWGHDFRPSFLELGALRREIGNPPVLALTATASQAVVAEITQQLGIPQAGVIGTGVYRPNLHYRAEAIGRPEDKLARLVALVKATPGSGLVYAATIKSAQEAFDALQAAGEPVSLYHGKLGAAKRRDTQDAFMDGRARVMVATNAFGLGVDKPDIRFVVHYQIPPSLDAYYQESGRAGRDGEPGECTLLFTEGDKAVQSFFLSGRYPDAEDFQALHATLSGPAPTADGWSLESVCTEAGRTRRKLQVALTVLCQQGIVKRQGEDSVSLLQPDLSEAHLNAIVTGYRDKCEQDRAALERMVAYAQGGRCRWRMLLEHFEQARDFERCTHCDNCFRLARHEAEAAQTQIHVSAPATAAQAAPRFLPGALVRTRRHGMGVVTAADALSVTVNFINGGERCFQPQFVEAADAPARKPRKRAARNATPIADGVLATAQAMPGLAVACA